MSEQNGCYRWVIKCDFINDGADSLVGYMVYRSEGVIPLPAPSNNVSKFEMYDGDDEVYFTGEISGVYDGFEPLDDLGHSYGCTGIRINGEEL